jgi:hypothetical protein
LQNADVLKYPLTNALRRSTIIPRDVRANILKVLNGSVGPDYFEVHADAQDSSSFSVS